MPLHRDPFGNGNHAVIHLDGAGQGPGTAGVRRWFTAVALAQGLACPALRYARESVKFGRGSPARRRQGQGASRGQKGFVVALGPAL
jgi:hypothetical protein